LEEIIGLLRVGFMQLKQKYFATDFPEGILDESSSRPSEYDWIQSISDFHGLNFFIRENYSRKGLIRVIRGYCIFRNYTIIEN